LLDQLLLAVLAAAQPAAPAAEPEDCQFALGPLFEGPDTRTLPGQVDGATLAGRDALLALRRARGDALIVVNGGRFARADFQGARLHNICFVGTDLSRSDWRGADAPGIAFVGADLRGARLEGARMARIVFRNANLENVHAERAMLAGGRLDGGWFEGNVDNLRLDGADLSGFRFECGISLDDGCPVETGNGGVTLRGANLAGANLFWRADHAGARINRTEALPEQIGDLREALIEGPIVVTGAGGHVEISPEEYRALLPHLRQPLQVDTAEQGRASAPPAWAVPGALALFADGPALFDEAFRNDPIYQRLLLVLVGTSESSLAVRVNPDGSVDVSGTAFGANAHSCSADASGLRFDPATGWYSGPDLREEKDAAQRGLVRVLLLDGDRAEIWRGGHADPEEIGALDEYASCGMRASFVPMVRVPDSAALAAATFESVADAKQLTPEMGE